MAGGVADAYQDGLVFGPGTLQCLGTPGIPINRIVCVLQQVGTGGILQSVGHGINAIREYADQSHAIRLQQAVHLPDWPMLDVSFAETPGGWPAVA